MAAFKELKSVIRKLEEGRKNKFPVTLIVETGSVEQIVKALEDKEIIKILSVEQNRYIVKVNISVNCAVPTNIIT